MTMRRRTTALLPLLLLAGCPSKSATPSPVTTQPAAAVLSTTAPRATPRPPPTHAPLSLTELPTTDGTIALGNLEASLNTARQLAELRPTDAGTRTRLIQLLCSRAQYRGTLSDYDRAAAEVDSLFKQAPKEGAAYFARAQVRLVFHEFAAAEADLAEAERLDSDLRPGVERLRLSLWVAQGKSEAALAGYRAQRKIAPDLSGLGAEAGLLADRGEWDAAQALYTEAQHYFRDVSPFPLSWLYLQNGLMWERAGRRSRAEDFFAAAVARLPGYAPATAHLAAALSARGQKAQALDLLQDLTRSADDPEYTGQLAGLLQELGRAAEAKPLIAQAAQRYTTLLQAHPRAFLSHAARFYLSAGAQPAQALKLAQDNLTANPSTEATLLAVEAATAAQASATACRLAETVAPNLGLSDIGRAVLSRAYSACGQSNRALAILAPPPPQPAP